MSDINIQLALDDLCTAVEGVTPRTAAFAAFERHKNKDQKLEDYDDVLGFRKFEWTDSSVGIGPAASDNTSGWYSFALELRLFYPESFWLDDDATYRGIVGIRLSDIVDLNKALMYGNPFEARSFDHQLLQMQRTRRSGKILTIPYLLCLNESLE